LENIPTPSPGGIPSDLKEKICKRGQEKRENAKEKGTSQLGLVNVKWWNMRLKINF
jgi:hypothetical protein